MRSIEVWIRSGIHHGKINQQTSKKRSTRSTQRKPDTRAQAHGRYNIVETTCVRSDTESFQPRHMAELKQVVQEAPQLFRLQEHLPLPDPGLLRSDQLPPRDIISKFRRRHLLLLRPSMCQLKKDMSDLYPSQYAYQRQLCILGRPPSDPLM